MHTRLASSTRGFVVERPVARRYYQRYECQRPELYFRKGSALMERVLRACPLLREPYRPTFWATNPHVQTMMSVLRKLSIRANFRRHLLPAPDGGTVGAPAAGNQRASGTKKDLQPKHIGSRTATNGSAQGAAGRVLLPQAMWEGMLQFCHTGEHLAGYCVAA